MATGTIQIIQNDKKDKWYLTDGLTESDVVAAYQFVYAPSKEDALVNINEGTKYTLSAGSSARWCYSSGIDFQDGVSSNLNLTNSTLSGLASSIKSAIYGFHWKNWAVGNLISIGLTDNRWLGHSNNLTSGTQWGFLMNGGNGWKSIGWRCPSGTLGCNFEENYIYVNGTKNTAGNSINGPYGRNHAILVYQAGDIGNAAGCVVPALVFYNKALTEAQHMAISRNIVNLGAIL